MKIFEILKYGKDELIKYDIDDASLKTKLLLMHLLNVSKEYLIINNNKEIDNIIVQKFNEFLNKLINGIPIQYITNRQEFMGLSFYVDENVLIPQPDTEILVEETIKISKLFKNNLEILDMCTGSGAIAISIKKAILDCKVTAADISTEALNIAKKNAINNKVDIELIKSNMFENIKTRKFDIIVSNPPYIETDTINNLSIEVQSEPKLALDGGTDGLDFYKIFSLEADKYLNSNGYLLLEIGYNQKEKIIKLLDNGKFTNIDCIKDLEGNNRVIIAKKV